MYEKITEILNYSWVQAIILIVIAVLLVRLLKIIIRRAVKKSASARAETLVRVLGNTISIIIYFLALLQILQIFFHVTPSSLLAATGIAGVAFGFGAQSLVKDVISGFFLLLENQMAVGDLVTIGSFTGNIQKITLRTTVIQNAAGDLYTIPNGSVTELINHSRCERSVVIETPVSYECDLNGALSVLQKAAETAASEMELLNGVPEVLGVSMLAGSGVNIKICAKCAPGNQFAVERELLRRIKYALDEANIEIPYDHIVIEDKRK